MLCCYIVNNDIVLKTSLNFDTNYLIIDGLLNGKCLFEVGLTLLNWTIKESAF